MSSATTLRWDATDPERVALTRSARHALERHATQSALGADLGWYGIGVPEALGGYGGTLADLAHVAEEVGAALGSGAATWTAAIAGAVLATAPNPPAELIGRLVESQQALAVAMVGRRLGDATSGLLSAELLALGPTDAPLVVPVIAATGPAILLIDASAPGVAAREVASLDATRSLTRFTLSNIAVGDATVVTHPDAEQAWTVAVGTLVALDATGAARTALTRTLDYSRTREQFGRAIGSFQAYKHRCSSAFIDLRLAQALAFAAADRGSADVAQRAARHCTSRAIHICSEAILLHGGIGFTAEAGLHAFLCRARLDEALACRERQLDQLIVSAATAEPTRS